jgi:iron complex outermembrane receptor protein
MLVDGIPESDSTGETSDLIGIDLDSAHAVEIVKGPMAAQYGASSSGVINVITAKGSPAPFILAKTLFGNYNFWKNQVELSGTQKKTAYLVDFTRTSSDGYREHAKMRTYRLNNRVDLQLDRQTVLTFLFRTADTDSQLPGNLSASNVAADRRQASFLFKLFDAQSNISRAQFGTLFNRHWGDAKSLSATFYVRHIGFEVPVPFVFLNGRRNSFGGDARFSLRQSMRKAQNTMIFGTSLQHDHEVRKDFNNVAGSKGTSVQRDETRRLLNTGFFFLDSFKATEKLDFRAALNYSRVRIQIDDFLLGDGNDSGKRLFEKLSYQFGTTYHLAPTFSLYGSISSGFDPPTITEIGRSPIGSGGLNPDLRPEISNNYEVGGLYTLAQKAFLNFALFRLKVHDQIVPTGIGFPQETFTNAAQSINNGLEVGGGVNILKDLNLRVGYTYSDFHYRTFINGFGDSSGNTIPGIPTNRFFGNLTYFHRSGFFGGIEGQAVGKIFVNDSNTVANDSYEVANWYAGYERNLKRLNLKLLYRMNNLFNEKYSAYIVVNDRFGGYFYPSPTRNNFGMVSVTWYF